MEEATGVQAVAAPVVTGVIKATRATKGTKGKRVDFCNNYSASQKSRGSQNNWTTLRKSAKGYIMIFML